MGIEVAVTKKFDKPGADKKLKSITAAIATDTAPSKNNMYYSLRLYFDNGGGPCYIISVGKTDGSPDDAKLKIGLDRVEAFDEPTIILFPEGQSLDEDKYYTLIGNAIDQCTKITGQVYNGICIDQILQRDSAMSAFRNSFKYGIIIMQQHIFLI